jgi:RNA polymerase sigma factor (sigma-70 family)
MSGTLPPVAPGAGEPALARAAASGDGNAFAILYDTYEKRIFNFCLRLLSDRHDAEDATQEAFIRVMRRLPELDPDQLEFGPYLFTAARNASYDVIDRRKKAEPGEAVGDELEGHLHRDRPDADTDPERWAMIETQRDAVREANDRLPERQREVLALRELEDMSYEQIASVMGMKQNAVAQLISRARIRLRGEVRLGAAVAVTPAGPDCEKALPLIAARQDEELADPTDRIWLETHLTGCQSCRLAEEQMAEAGISYRAWVPVAPAAWLFRDTLAKASEITGSDWSHVQRPGGKAPRSRRVAVSVAAGVAVLSVLGAALMAGTIGDSSLDPVERSRPASAKAADDPRDAREGQGKRERDSGEQTADAPLPGSGGTPLGDQPAPSGNTGGDGGSGQTDGGGSSGGGSAGGDPNGGTSPTPTPTPDPAPTPTPPPTTTPPPSTTPPTPGGPGPTPPNPPPIPGGPGGFTSGS